MLINGWWLHSTGKMQDTSQLTSLPVGSGIASSNMFCLDIVMKVTLWHLCFFTVASLITCVIRLKAIREIGAKTTLVVV